MSIEVLHSRVPDRVARRPWASRCVARTRNVSEMCPPVLGAGNTKVLFAGTLPKPSDGLEPSTPSLPCTSKRNRSQPTATVLAYLCAFSAVTICDRLRPVATTGLHKGSIPARTDPVWPELRTATTHIARIFAKLVLQTVRKPSCSHTRRGSCNRARLRLRSTSASSLSDLRAETMARPDRDSDGQCRSGSSGKYRKEETDANGIQAEQ